MRTGGSCVEWYEVGPGMSGSIDGTDGSYSFEISTNFQLNVNFKLFMRCLKNKNGDFSIISQHIYLRSIHAHQIWHQNAKCSSLRWVLTRPPHFKQTKLLPSANASNTICVLPVSASIELP